MSNLVVLGAQWGDEGKGKLVDLLAPGFDIVVRYQGGANAGHTVVVEGEKYILHQVPSGIIAGAPVSVVANGTVIDPEGLVAELDELQAKGIELDNRFLLSDRAQIVMPYHRSIDLLGEESRGRASIGTTGRGIGPAYESKIAREGLRIGDLRNLKTLRDKVFTCVGRINDLIVSLYSEEPLNAEEIYESLARSSERLTPYISDASQFLFEQASSGKRLIFEGAQGTMLDIDHGTYPYVTSSNTTIGGVIAGTGLPPRFIGSVMGVAKAYCTRVGKGPFPTEEKGSAGEKIREIGAEFGATTGRPRRCGWFDAVAVGYAARVNGFDALAITKLDVLDQSSEIPVCVAYELDGKRVEMVPASVEDYNRCQPVYETVQGWSEDTTGIGSYDELPGGAKRYVDYLSRLLDLPVPIISVGPERSQALIRGELIRELNVSG